MTPEDFDKGFRTVLDALLRGMAEHPEVDVKKFYNTAYFIENISFFSPFFYSLVENTKRKNKDAI